MQELQNGKGLNKPISQCKTTDARLLYKNDVDFATLALQSPPFNKLFSPPLLFPSSYFGKC